MIRSPNCRLSKKNRSPGDTLGSSNMDAPNPRLVSSRKANREDHIRKELSGEAAKEKKAKITLPKFSWDKKDD